jgi:hypothetical protein
VTGPGMPLSLMDNWDLKIAFSDAEDDESCVLIPGVHQTMIIFSK